MNKDMYILLRSNTIYTYIYKYRYREREKNSPTHPKLQNCSRPAHVDPATGGVVTEDVPPLPPPPPPEWGWGQGWLERGKLEFLEDDFPELEICFLDLRCFEFKMHRSWIVGLSKNHHEDSVTSFITSVFFSMEADGFKYYHMVFFSMSVCKKSQTSKAAHCRF
jgi:hypothetical protein